MNGYKTYIASALTVVWALYGLYSGNLDAAQAVQLISTAAIGSAIRHGIATAGK